MKKVIIYTGICILVITAIVYQTINPIQSEIIITNKSSQKRTRVSFDIQDKCFIKFAAYDPAGKEVATLINKDLEAGTYKLYLNEVKLANGEYFYKLTSQDPIDIKKVTLIKFTEENFSYK